MKGDINNAFKATFDEPVSPKLLTKLEKELGDGIGLIPDKDGGLRLIDFSG